MKGTHIINFHSYVRILHNMITLPENSLDQGFGQYIAYTSRCITLSIGGHTVTLQTKSNLYKTT